MATNKIGFPRTDSWIGFLEESTFGTAQVDGSNFTILDVADNSVPSFEEADFLDNEKRNDETNVIHNNDFFRTTNGIWQRYTIPPFIATCENAADFVYAATQTVSEAVGDPYEKTYTMAGTTKPDFSSDAGYFFTLLVKEPFSSFSKKLTSCVLENFEIVFDYAANGGRGTISGTALTGKGFTGTSNPSGSNSHNTTGVLSCHDSTASTLSINALDMVWYRVAIRVENRFDWIGYSSGNADNYGLIGQKIFFDAMVKYDANTDTFLNTQNQNIGAIDFDIGDTSSADPAFAFDAPAARGTVTLDRGGTDNVQKVNLSLECARTGSDIVFKVADGVDQTW